MKGYTTFSLLGAHPALYAVRDRLILSGYPLVLEEPDFLLIGCDASSAEDATKLCTALLDYVTLRPKLPPTLVLSTGAVYGDRNLDLTVADKRPTTEDTPILVPSSLDSRCWRPLTAAWIEQLVLRHSSRPLVLRSFNLYGPDMPGVVNKLIQAAKTQQPCIVYHPGYQTRSFLPLNEFLECFDLVLYKFLNRNAQGLFNIGSEEDISIRRLADSVWQLVNGPNVPINLQIVQAPYRTDWWRLPDTTRIRAWTRWRPRTTIRRGLWELVNNGKA